MAKLYKVECYLCDVNEYFKDIKDLKDYFHILIDREYYLFNPVDFKVTESKEIEWYDNIDLNCYGCTEEDCKKYFE